MIKAYFLKVLKDEVTNTEYTEGSEFISQAICETTEKPDIRRVIIEENPNLASLALKVEEPTDRDIENYNSLPELALTRNLLSEIDDLKARLGKLENQPKKEQNMTPDELHAFVVDKKGGYRKNVSKNRLQ